MTKPISDDVAIKTYDVMVTGRGSNPIALMKVIRQIAGDLGKYSTIPGGLKEAKDLVDAVVAAPQTLVKGVGRGVAEAIGQQINAAGGLAILDESEDPEYATAVDKGIFGSETPGQPQPCHYVCSPLTCGQSSTRGSGHSCTRKEGEGHRGLQHEFACMARPKVSKGYVVILRERPREGSGSIVRAIWDAAPRESGDLLPLTNLIKNLPAEVLSTTDKVLAARLRDSLLALGCKVTIEITKLGVPSLTTIPLNQLTEDPANPRSGPVFTEFQFLAHLAELTGLYIEGAKDDDPDWLVHLGSLEGGAVDFAKFVQALDGEVSEPDCPHGKSNSESCEQCVSEGRYTHAQPVEKKVLSPDHPDFHKYYTRVEPEEEK